MISQIKLFSETDIAPSDFHFFTPMKETLRGKSYGGDEEVKPTVKNWPHQQPAEFYEAGSHALIFR